MKGLRQVTVLSNMQNSTEKVKDNEETKEYVPNKRTE